MKELEALGEDQRTELYDYLLELLKVPGAIHVGERDDTLIKIACRMRTYDMDKDVAFWALASINDDYCESDSEHPPITDSVVKQKLNSAWKYEPGWSEEAIERAGQSGNSKKEKKGKKDKRTSQKPTSNGRKDEWSTPLLSTRGGKPEYGFGITEKTLDYIGKVFAPLAPFKGSSNCSVQLEAVKKQKGADISRHVCDSPCDQLKAQMKCAFRPGDYIYFVDAEEDGKTPKSTGRTFSYFEAMADPQSVLDLDKDGHGLFMCVNPVKRDTHTSPSSDSVTHYRNVLLENDEMAIKKQITLMVALRYPCACITLSGGRSSHAIISSLDPCEDIGLDAWTKRRNAYYAVGTDNGLVPDPRCKPAVHLTRVAGAERNGNMQLLVATLHEIGGACRCWSEWQRWVQAQLDATLKPYYFAAHKLIEENDGCMVDGIPALRYGNRWSAGPDKLEAAIHGVLKDESRSARSEAVSTFRLDAPERNQAPTNIIAVANGFLDIDTMQLSSSCDEPVLNVIPVDWVPNAKSDELDKAMDSFADGYSPTIANLEEMAGMCLLRSANEQQLVWVLLGEGHNGKSVWIKTLEAMVGTSNYTTVEPSAAVNEKFMRKQLCAKLLWAADDPTSGTMPQKIVSLLKNVSAGSAINTDWKFNEPFDFVPYAACIFAYNRYPTISGYDGGIERRLKPVPFTHRFSEADGDDNPDILKTLCSKEVQEALLVRAVNGLKRLRAQGKETFNPKGQAFKLDIRSDSDSITAWMEDESVDESYLCSKTSTGDSYRCYTSWCEESGYRPEKKQTWCRRMKQTLKVEIKTKRLGEGSSSHTVKCFDTRPFEQ